MVSNNIKLAVENVSKTFRVRGGQYSENHLLPVLRRVSFDVYENEIVSLIGESGCGKTTLLRIVQGLVRRDAGEIRVDGQPVAGAGRDRGFVFQQANLLPWRSARANRAPAKMLIIVSHSLPRWLWSMERLPSTSLPTSAGWSRRCRRLPRRLNLRLRPRSPLAHPATCRRELRWIWTAASIWSRSASIHRGTRFRSAVSIGTSLCANSTT